MGDRPVGCPAHFKARQRETTDFPTWLHHSAGHNLRGATLIVEFTVTDEFRQPDPLAQMFWIQVPGGWADGILLVTIYPTRQAKEEKLKMIHPGRVGVGPQFSEKFCWGVGSDFY